MPVLEEIQRRLPDGWGAAVTEDGYYYYFDPDGVSVWEPPTEGWRDDLRVEDGEPDPGVESKEALEDDEDAGESDSGDSPPAEEKEDIARTTSTLSDSSPSGRTSPELNASDPPQLPEKSSSPSSCVSAACVSPRPRMASTESPAGRQQASPTARSPPLRESEGSGAPVNSAFSRNPEPAASAQARVPEGDRIGSEGVALGAASNEAVVSALAIELVRTGWLPLARRRRDSLVLPLLAKRKMPVSRPASERLILEGGFVTRMRPSTRDLSAWLTKSEPPWKSWTRWFVRLSAADGKLRCVHRSDDAGQGRVPTLSLRGAHLVPPPAAAGTRRPTPFLLAIATAEHSWVLALESRAQLAEWRDAVRAAILADVSDAALLSSYDSRTGLWADPCSEWK